MVTIVKLLRKSNIGRSLLNGYCKLVDLLNKLRLLEIRWFLPVFWVVSNILSVLIIIVSQPYDDARDTFTLLFTMFFFLTATNIIIGTITKEVLEILYYVMEPVKRTNVYFAELKGNLSVDYGPLKNQVEDPETGHVYRCLDEMLDAQKLMIDSHIDPELENK